jgi:hypothetical protein
MLLIDSNYQSRELKGNSIVKEFSTRSANNVLESETIAEQGENITSMNRECHPGPTRWIILYEDTAIRAVYIRY